MATEDSSVDAPASTVPSAGGRGRGGGRRHGAESAKHRSARHRSHVRRRGGTNAWYATSIKFQRALLAGLDAHVEHRGQVTFRLTRASAVSRWPGERILVVEHAGLDVPARREPVPVRIEFHENPDYNTYGLHAGDYPRVLADPGAISKHRLPGDALCLWFPRDPEERRWHHSDGLLTLFNTARNHLFFEDYWRSTGGHGGPGQPEGIWLGDEAPHGFPTQENAA